jgi:hypothetical protein
MSTNSLCIYISDCGPHRVIRLAKDVRVITSAQHDRAFGTVLSTLRLFATPDSTSDLHWGEEEETYPEEADDEDSVGEL